MFKKGKNANLIILILVGLLFILLIIITTILQIMQNKNKIDLNDNKIIVSNKQVLNERIKTIKEIIEEYDSEFLSREKNIFVKIYVNFKYDLFDEDGKSRKQYFYDMIEDLAEIEKDTFYLIDTEKNIEIYVLYDNIKETYKVIINDVEDYYNETNGDIYVDLKNTKIAEAGDFNISNSDLFILTSNNMYYTGESSIFSDFDARVDLGNGYYSYKDGTMIAKTQSKRIINLILTRDYDEEIGRGFYVTTPLKEIYEKCKKVAFGGVKEGYLCYRTDKAYTFFYEDEVSIYASQYTERKEFDEYLSDYCKSGNLEKLNEDFTKNWGNYYEHEYNPELQKLKLSYPSRGIEIDIENNNSRGIKIYNNYYLTDTVKELIKSHKITLVEDKDLVHVVEQARRQNKDKE